MSHYTTIVIRMPEGEAEKKLVNQSLKALEPFRTAMSIEDDMTILELIENHPDFDEAIAEEARAETLRLHARAEAAA